MTTSDRTRVLLLAASLNSVREVEYELASIWKDFPWIDGYHRMSFETALIELVTNVLSYGQFVGVARLEVTVGRDMLSADLTDDGHPFLGDLSTIVMPDWDAEAGRGLAMAMGLTDVISYERRDGRNVWSIRLSLTTDGESHDSC